jgi:hypothetical protein
MMTLAELYLPDFDQEMTNTRRVLERIPTEKFDDFLGVGRRRAGRVS